MTYNLSVKVCIYYKQHMLVYSSNGARMKQYAVYLVGFFFAAVDVVYQCIH